MNSHGFRAPLLTPVVRWFLLFSFLGNASLSVLFAVLPLFAEETSGSSLAAGLTTGVMMLATVLVELVSPRLIADFGYRRVLESGIALMGFPGLILVAMPNIGSIMTVSALRGAGLAITVVAGTALAPQLFPEGRRAEGLGIYGLVLAIPSVLFLPLGIWIADHVGFDAVFLGAALMAAIGLAVSRMLPSNHPGQRPTHGIMAELLDPAIARPTVVFSIATLAIGILITYLALAVPDDARNVAAIGLLVQAICTAVTRWGAGRLGDAVGSHRLLAPSMLLAALGMVCIIATDSSVAVIGGMALFGLGLGGAQNASLAVMFDRAPRERFAQVSVIWNLAYDAGMGIGAVGFGLVSRQTGYPWGFAMVAVLLFAATILAALDRTPASVKPQSVSTA